MPSKKTHYAVRRGRIPGIYRNWDDCQVQVKGYSNAKFKGFQNQAGAEAFMAEVIVVVVVVLVINVHLLRVLLLQLLLRMKHNLCYKRRSYQICPAMKILLKYTHALPIK